MAIKGWQRRLTANVRVLGSRPHQGPCLQPFNKPLSLFCCRQRHQHHQVRKQQTKGSQAAA